MVHEGRIASVIGEHEIKDSLEICWGGRQS